MSDVISTRNQSTPILTKSRQRLSVIDCDIHPQIGSKDEIVQFLPDRWQDYAPTYGRL